MATTISPSRWLLVLTRRLLSILRSCESVANARWPSTIPIGRRYGLGFGEVVSGSARNEYWLYFLRMMTGRVNSNLHRDPCQAVGSREFSRRKRPMRLAARVLAFVEENFWTLTAPG